MNRKITTISYLLFANSAHATGTSNPLGGWEIGVLALLSTFFIIGFHIYLFRKLSAHLNPPVSGIIIIRRIVIYSIMVFWGLFFIYGYVQNSSPISFILVSLHFVSFISPFLCWIIFKFRYEKNLTSS